MIVRVTWPVRRRLGFLNYLHHRVLDEGDDLFRSHCWVYFNEIDLVQYCLLEGAIMQGSVLEES